jgi:hypothetical protein
MRALLPVFLLLAALVRAGEIADREAIGKVLTTFNNLRERATVLAPGADLTPLDRFAGQEVSQVYFEARTIGFVNQDVAFVDATASQFGSMIMKHAMPAHFVLRRIGGEWRVAVMRVPEPVGLSSWYRQRLRGHL